jgi:hypothetical protein
MYEISVLISETNEEKNFKGEIQNLANILGKREEPYENN